MTRQLLLKFTTGLFWLALTFTLVMALLPKLPVPYDFQPSDKVWHAIAFAVMTLLAAAAFPRQKHLVLFTVLALLGGLIEVLQMIPALHRNADLKDWLADCVAVIAVLLTWELGAVLFKSKNNALDEFSEE